MHNLTSIGNELIIARKNSDQLFKLIFGALIMFMQCGFGFLEAGRVRAKNTVNILMKNMLDLCKCSTVKTHIDI